LITYRLGKARARAGTAARAGAGHLSAIGPRGSRHPGPHRIRPLVHTARLALAFSHGPWRWLALCGLALVALFGSNDLAPLPRQPAAPQPEPAGATGMLAAPPGPAERLAS
jgi:hypothetical protein